MTLALEATYQVNHPSGDPRSAARKPRNKSELYGQVLTPVTVADHMAKLLARQLRGCRVMDPCVGLATFPKALVRKNKNHFKLHLTLLDIDPAMVIATRSWVKQHQERMDVSVCDYLTTRKDKEFDGIILNPPFVRQEWIDQKEYYRALFMKRYGLGLPGTSNLYVYFIVKTIQDLRPGGVFVCIVYDSWQFTRFGLWLAQYLENECESLVVQPIGSAPFDGHLVDATIITGRRRLNAASSSATRTVSLVRKRSAFAGVRGFVPLRDVYTTRRGLRLKQASFFLCSASEGKDLGATPFLKKVAKVTGYSVSDGHDEAALLVSRPDQNDRVRAELRRRLQDAIKCPESNVSILTWHTQRPDTWYLHADPPYAPIVFNYYIRSRPRHIYNPKHGYSDNFYGLADPEGIPTLASLALMNSTAVSVEILVRSRNQGNGLSKIQLFEYREAFIPDPRLLESGAISALEDLGRKMTLNPANAGGYVSEIDSILADEFRDSRLSPTTLQRREQRLLHVTRIEKKWAG